MPEPSLRQGPQTGARAAPSLRIKETLDIGRTMKRLRHDPGIPWCRLREDIATAQSKDPAAGSAIAVMMLSPGLHAIWAHRIHHWLWRRGHRFIARLGAQTTRTLTGVEIHPAARIGRRVFIDHGMGVVIGETAEVGDDVLVYHGVTLGGQRPQPGKRHPTIGCGVTIGAGAAVLGPITIGAYSTIGAGAVVTRSFPAGTTIVGVPGESVKTTAVADCAVATLRSRNDWQDRAAA